MRDWKIPADFRSRRCNTDPVSRCMSARRHFPTRRCRPHNSSVARNSRPARSIRHRLPPSARRCPGPEHNCHLRGIRPLIRCATRSRRFHPARCSFPHPWGHRMPAPEAKQARSRVRPLRVTDSIFSYATLLIIVSQIKSCCFCF